MRKLVSVSILFFAIAYAILSFFSYNSFFCAAQRTGHNHALTTARLALALSVWNFFACWCGSLVLAHGKKHSFHGRTAVVVTLSTAIAGVGFISLPFWIYRGYGVFWFENTWMDVSCFFSRKLRLVFSMFVVPTP